MHPSRHNIISRIKDSENYFIVNVLSGHADIISSRERMLFDGLQHAIPEEYIQKGYFADHAKENLEYKLKYINHLEQRDKEEVQIFFAPTYQCNFRCSYCYQAGYDAAPEQLSPQVVDAFFEFVNIQFGDRPKYITLFGGEPLLPGKHYKESLSYFFKKCGENHLDLAIVTNGYHLDDYFEELQQVNIREIQFTLDGPAEVHNQRRPHQGGHDTFDRISDNLQLCLKNDIAVNLRVVLDRDNLKDLPELAAYAIERGWTSNPLFKTQLGRNYELHYCQAGRQKLYSRLELYQDLYLLVHKHPEVMTFHQPSWSITRFLSQNGELPGPLFDACPACKSEWAMDYKGNIYSCTATVGKPGESLGTFFPGISLNEQSIKEWKDRDVTTISKCSICNLQLACGGGCGSLAKNKHGSIHEPDCRPVTELIELGMKVYFIEGSEQ